MSDPIQIENTINGLRNDLAAISNRAEVFGLLPERVRGPILEKIAKMLQELRDGVNIVRNEVEREVSRQRGDDEDDYRRKFRQAT